MRVAGWILLIAGALLCVTLVWATVGFLLMGVGLLSLLVAENRRRRVSVTTLGHAPADERMALLPVPEPVVSHAPLEPISPPAVSYDRQAWRQLVESDADLARITSVLADYGQQYVDELACEYMADVDKQRLPDIVEGIIGRASVAPRGNGELVDDARPPNPVGSATAARRPPRLLPESTLKLSEKSSDSASSPVEPARRQEAIGAPAEPPTAVDPAPGEGDSNKTIISADEELTAMLGKLSADAATPSKS